MVRTTLSEAFSETIRGTRWKERQEQYHQAAGEFIFGPDSLLCWCISALLFLLFFLAGPDGRDAHFESWRWLLHALFLFILPGIKAMMYSNSKNPKMAYWGVFLSDVMIFMSGAMVGMIILSRFS